MATVTVRHQGGAYPVRIEPGQVGKLDSTVRSIAGNRPQVLVTDRTVARLVPFRWRGHRLLVPAGERGKSPTQWLSLLERLAALGIDRDGVLVAVGGGALLDVVGFAAASYLRGVAVVYVPTTLLAMVDASIGGKTAINLGAGKNLVGAFHPPLAVLIDPVVTQSQRLADFRSGLVEAVKHGLIADDRYLRWIERNRSHLLARDAGAVSQLVRRSVAIKAGVVERDEREAGVRATLNAGHTVGHALEQLSGYRRRHGEAVALGLAVEASLALRLGHGPADLPNRIDNLWRALGVPHRLPPASVDRRLVASMRTDKKNRGAEIHIAPIGTVGRAVRSAGPWTIPVSEPAIRQALIDTRGAAANSLSTTFPHSRRS